MGPFYSWEVRKELKEVHVAYVDGNQSKRYQTKHAAMSSNFNQLPQIQAVTLDCDLSCAESVDCNTAGLVQAIQSFLHLDLYMFFI